MPPSSPAADAPIASPRRALLGLVFVLIAAFALRTIGLDYLLPQLHEPDAYVTVQTDYFQGSYEEEKPFRHFFYYPLFLSRTLLVVPGPVWNEGIAAEAPLEEHLAHSASPFLRVRWLVALLSWGLIPVTWLLARRFMGAWSATLAAAWLATASLHLLFGAQGRPHGSAATLTVLAVVCAIGLRRQPTAGRYLLTGAVAALALCNLQNGAAAFLALAAAHLLRERGKAKAPVRRTLAHLALAALPLALFVPLFYPIGIEKPETKKVATAFDHVQMDGSVITYGGHQIDLANFDGSGTVTVARTLWWHDPALVVMAIAGLVVAFGRRKRRVGDDAEHRSRRRDLWVALAHALPYAFVICLYARSWDRYALPLYPYLCCLAALAGTWIVVYLQRAISSPVVRRLATAAAVIVPLALPSYAALHRLRLRLAPDTVEATAAWVRENVQDGERVAIFTHRTPLPLFYEPKALASSHKLNDGQRLRWLDYQSHLPSEPRSDETFELYHLETYSAFRKKKTNGRVVKRVLDELKADYVVMEDTGRIRALPSMRIVQKALRTRGELVARFVPRADTFPDVSFRDYQDEPRALARTLEAQRHGPVMEVYRWPREQSVPGSGVPRGEGSEEER